MGDFILVLLMVLNVAMICWMIYLESFFIIPLNAFALAMLLYAFLEGR